VKRPNNEALGIGEQGTAKKGEQKIIVLGQLFICYGPCNTLIGALSGPHAGIDKGPD
jgi:hypothetical protein